ncbi:hypothetical protein FRC00_012571 [Tulasnella sp. 408]|nr:hypothetical protein FRC00_012571 [Tulasnella sp. 408]
MENQPLIPCKRKPTPLPKRQLVIIFFARLAEPIAYTQIFPYIAQMVEELHIASDKKKIGFYAGLIYTYPLDTDRIGRKPVVLIGLSGVCIATLMVIKSMVSDITDETNEGQGRWGSVVLAGLANDAPTVLPLVPATFAAGTIVGPLIGGLLAHPAERYPKVFGKFELLRRKPFFLPCFVSSILTLLSITSTILFLNETLPSIVKTKASLKDPGVKRDYGTIDANAVKPENQPPTAWQASDSMLSSLYLHIHPSDSED